MADGGRDHDANRRDDHDRRDPRDRRDASNSQEGRDSQYPPPPGEEDNRPYPPAQPIPQSNVNLPPIHQAGYHQPGAVIRHGPVDPRARQDYSGSPSGAGPQPYGNPYPPGLSSGYPAPYQPGLSAGYPAPYQQGPPSSYPAPPQPGGSYQLPPVTASPLPRYGPDGRPDYYPHPQQHAGPGYPPPPQQYGDQMAGYAYAQPQQPPPVSRQRTAIACRYCRKRKIRCSGYNQPPDGKCTNCVKSRHDCVFQPVSSGAGAAFVSVQSLPGGKLPAGTQVYGAFGQPLAREDAPNTGPPPPAQPGYGHAHMAPGGGGHVPFYPPAPASDYSMTSPTSSTFHAEDRFGGAGPRRRIDDDGGHGSRLPPPNVHAGVDPRRRSPASLGSNNSPPSSHEGGEGQQRGSPNGSTSGSYGSGGHARMSLSHMLDGNQQRGPPPSAPSLEGTQQQQQQQQQRAAGDGNRDIDHDMLGRLNQRKR